MVCVLARTPGDGQADLVFQAGCLGRTPLSLVVGPHKEQMAEVVEASAEAQKAHRAVAVAVRIQQVVVEGLP